MDKIIRIGMDTSKRFFQLHGVNAAEQPVLRKTLRRHQVEAFFVALEPTVVGIEACGGAHHWARVLGRLGHRVLLMPPQYVKPYVKRGKNDAADAEALCEAMSRPTMRFVPVKTEAEQAALMLLGVREQLVRRRTQLANMIRGHAAEFGLVAAKGLCRIEPLLERIAANAELPETARWLFVELGAEYAAVQARLAPLDRALKAWSRQSPHARALMRIEGIGPICAAALVLKAPHPEAFPTGRHFAAWIGLTPKDHSTANKQRLGVITKAGDEALRSLLVNGATAVIQQIGRGRTQPSPWLAGLLARKEPKEAAVALANKMARIAWKLMVSAEPYRPGQIVAAMPKAEAA